MTKKIHLCFLFLLLFTSCAHEEVKPTPPIPVQPPTTPPIVEETKNYDQIFQNNLKEIWGSYFKENFNDSRSLDIFIVTNRQAKEKNFGCTNQYFGINPDPIQDLRYGICRINVPKNHSTGEIEFSSDQKVSSHKYFKIVNAKLIKDQALFDFIKKSKRTPLIFVHGFNVKYQDAVLRASQITYDLKYQGPVILFTWPSGAGDSFLDDKLLNRTYEQNQKSAKVSVQLFKKFISKFKENNIPINLVVHSMGHQVVLPALNEMGEASESDEDKKIVNELILNAPDYEVSEFQNNIESIINTAKRITLYCSFNDKAMVASSTFNKTERLGACAPVDGIDTINVSLVDDQTFGLGHSYYSSRDVITDVFQVLLGLDAEKRLFMKKSEPNSTEKFFLRN